MEARIVLESLSRVFLAQAFSSKCGALKINRRAPRLAQQGALNILKCGRASRIAGSEAEAWAAVLPALGR